MLQAPLLSRDAAAALMQRAEHCELCFSVVLKGVDSSVDENTLRLACGKFGPVVAVSMAKIGSVPKVPTGSIAVGTASSIVKSLRCAIVDFKNEADADASVAAWNLIVGVLDAPHRVQLCAGECL